MRGHADQEDCPILECKYVWHFKHFNLLPLFYVFNKNQEFYLSFTEPKIALPDRQSDVKGHSFIHLLSVQLAASSSFGPIV